MYSGALAMLLFVPLALGSYWAPLLFPAPFAIVVWRLLDEETFLLKKLPGYDDYRRPPPPPDSIPLVTATAGGIPASVTFAGPRDAFVGLDQVNILLPHSLAGKSDIVVQGVLNRFGECTGSLTLAARSPS